MPPERQSLFVGGSWRRAHGPEGVPVIAAATEEVIGSVPAGSPADVDAAVAAAREAFDDAQGWASWAGADRAKALARFADALAARAGEIAATVSTQNGMPIQLSSFAETRVPAKLLRYYGDLVATGETEELRMTSGGRRSTLVRRSPVGVVAAIVPWNFPQSLAFFKLAPALAAGCTVVLKPSPETTLDALLVAEAAADAELPPGVLNIVPGGRDVGAYLVEHPQVDKVAFTGSTAAGRAIAARCGELLRPVTLELGGKSAAIVLEDADLGFLGRNLFPASLLHGGQTCYSSTRILAPRRRYGAVVDAITDLVSSLVVGDPLESSTQIGPLVSSAQRERVEGFIEAGRAEGGRITTGGGRPRGLTRGWFVEPTVIADVTNEATVAREEIFGPVLAVIPYDGVDDAIRIANDSPYGLGGTVWSADVDRAAEVARRIHTGAVGINQFTLDIEAPFGGVKASGLGRELGPEGLLAYQELQTVYLSA